jgi:hypothetical protein
MESFGMLLAVLLIALTAILAYVAWEQLSVQNSLLLTFQRLEERCIPEPRDKTLLY